MMGNTSGLCPGIMTVVEAERQRIKEGNITFQRFNLLFSLQPFWKEKVKLLHHCYHIILMIRITISVIACKCPEEIPCILCTQSYRIH